jgi:hypothetical protein
VSRFSNGQQSKAAVTAQEEEEEDDDDGEDAEIPQEIRTPFSLASFLSHVSDKIHEEEPSTSSGGRGDRKRRRDDEEEEEEKEFVNINGCFARVNKRQVSFFRFF